MNTKQFSLSEMRLNKTRCNFSQLFYLNKLYIFGGYSYFNQVNELFEELDFQNKVVT